jgi:2-dehydro-3-deoxygluconokinase
VRRLPGRLPGLYLIEVDAAGERRFSYWRDQAAARAYFDTPDGATPLEQQADGIDALYFSGISLAILPPAARERLAGAGGRPARARRGRGVRQQLPAAAVARCGSQARTASPVHGAGQPGADDAGRRAGAVAEPDADAQLQRTLALPCAEVVVKRGARRPWCATGGAGGGGAHRAGCPVVDTTAAGDSFAGAYLAARLAGAPPAEAARHGNRLAARVVQHRGAMIPAERMADLPDERKPPAHAVEERPTGRASTAGLAVPNSFSAEVMAHQGWDTLTIDLQHGVIDYAAMVACCRPSAPRPRCRSCACPGSSPAS